MDFLDLTNKEIEINTREESPSNRPVDVSTSPCKAVKEICSMSILEDYDQNEHDFKFRQSHYMCNVCFVEKSGVVCFRYIPCHHVYCNDCMKEYFEVQINEGKVTSLTCPFDKCESQALPLQVRFLLRPSTTCTLTNTSWVCFPLIVGLKATRPGTVHKVWKFIDTQFTQQHVRHSVLSTRSLSKSRHTGMCSRDIWLILILTNKWDKNKKEENMARCPSCQYVFCTMCRQGFHGIEPCKLANCEFST